MKYLIILLISVGICSAQLPIPPERLVNWGLSGVPGGIELYSDARTTIYTNIPLPTTAAAINDALKNAPTNSIVMLGPGTLTLVLADSTGDKSIKVPSQKTLRGTRLGSPPTNATIIKQAAFTFAGDWGNRDITNRRTIAANVLKDSSTITFTTAIPSSYTVGTVPVGRGFGFITQTDEDDIDVGGAEWCFPCHQYGTNASDSHSQHFCQVARVVTVNSPTSITIWPPVVTDIKTSLDAKFFFWVEPNWVVNAGIEDLTIKEFNASHVDSLVQPISTRCAYGCWFKNIKVVGPPITGGGHAALFVWSLQNTIRSVDIQMNKYTTANNYCFENLAYNAWNRFEDCSAANATAGFHNGCGTVGMVYGYCYSTNMRSSHSGYETNFMADFSTSHGMHPYFNLYEGSIVGKVRADQLFSSVRHLTLHRNWFYGWQPMQNEVLGHDLKYQWGLHIENLCWDLAAINILIGGDNLPLDYDEINMYPSGPFSDPDHNYAIQKATAPGSIAPSSSVNSRNQKVIDTLFLHGVRCEYGDNNEYWESGYTTDLGQYNSLYVNGTNYSSSTPPVWWPSLTRWPPIGIEYGLNPKWVSIPARDRFYGSLPVDDAGDIFMASSDFLRSENVGTVTVYAKRSGGSIGASSVSYTTVNGTAIAGSDYTTASGSLNWADGESEVTKSVVIDILNDAIAESTKSFSFVLSDAINSTLISPTSLIITITDDDSYGYVKFTDTQVYSTVENDDYIRVFVERYGGETGAASLQYFTSNGSAKAGTNYVATSGTVSWASGEITNKFIQISLIDNTVVSGDLSFNVNITNAVGASLMFPTNISIIIDDDESVLYERTIIRNSNIKGVINLK